MNEDYVSTKLARKLQQKGYPLKKVYRQNGFPMFYDLPQDHPDWSQCDAWYLPTIWEVLKWLREEKKIHISIDIWGRTWGYDILNLPSGSSLHWTAYEENINNYEQAAIAGIEYVLDNLI